LMMIITPDILKSFTTLKVCTKENNKKTIEEHRNIVEMISAKNPEGAISCMAEHLQDVLHFGESESNR